MSDLPQKLDELKVRPRAAVALSDGPTIQVEPARQRTVAEVLGGAEYSRAVTGSAATAGCCDQCWRVDTLVPDLCLAAEDWRTASAGQPAACSLTLRRHSEGPLVLPLAAALVLDIETGGFAGTPVFLIGVVRLGQHPLRVAQFLARDYPEEPAILRGLAEAAAGCDTWVSFNGKSFDEPFLRDRAAIHRVALPTPRVHVDLLHAARRAWRGTVTDCRLATLEREILGRRRCGDVPSREVPDLFHLFCLTGNAGPLRPVLEHNRQDLIAATELLFRLGGTGDLPAPARE